LELIGQLYTVERECPACDLAASENTRAEDTPTASRSAPRAVDRDRRRDPRLGVSAMRVAREQSREGDRLHARALGGADALPDRRPHSPGHQRDRAWIAWHGRGEKESLRLPVPARDRSCGALLLAHRDREALPGQSEELPARSHARRA